MDLKQKSDIDSSFTAGSERRRANEKAIVKRFALLLAVMILAAPVTSLAPANWYVDTANKKQLNLREFIGYDERARIIAVIPYGAKVYVINFVSSDVWAYVKFDGLRGYCKTRYLSPNKPDSKDSGESETKANPYRGFKFVF